LYHACEKKGSREKTVCDACKQTVENLLQTLINKLAKATLYVGVLGPNKNVEKPLIKHGFVKCAKNMGTVELNPKAQNCRNIRAGNQIKEQDNACNGAAFV